MRIAGTVLASAIAIGQPAAVVGGQAPAAKTAPPPVSATESDPGLAAVRDGILAAAEARSFDRLAPFLAPDVAWMFQGYRRQAFIRKAKAWPAAGADTFWAGVRTALSMPVVLGGHDDAIAPYVARVAVPAEDWVVLTAADVPVRAEPSLAAKPIATLSYAILPLAPPMTAGSWKSVRLPSGQVGWVDGRSVGSPLGFRIRFIKVAGVWKASAFAVGD